MILEYVVKQEDINKTINKILEERFELSNRLFSKLIRNKRITVNNTNIDTRQTAKMEDFIQIDLNYKEDNSNIVSKKMNLDIVFEDDAILVLNKPAGIAVHPSMLHYEDSLASGVKYYFEEKRNS